MYCSEGHPLRLGSRGFVFNRYCNLCHGEIPRVAPRHRCWRCSFNVCYDCAMHLTWRSGVILPDRSSSSIVLGKPKKLSELFHSRVERKQQTRAMLVAVSKDHDIAEPVSGLIRTLHHNRRRNGIAEDCRNVAYSSAQLRLHPPGVDAVPAPWGVGAPSAGPPLPAGARGGWMTDAGGAVARPPVPASVDHAYGGNLARCVLERARLLVDIVGQELEQNIDCLDSAWMPPLPVLDGNSPTDGGMISWLLGGGDEALKLQVLAGAAQKVLESQPLVSEVAVPAKVFGDVHGQLRDLLLLFHFYGGPDPAQDIPGVSYVFNGDWVDRGVHQLEVVAILFALKIAFPERTWLNRGNHEDMNQNRKVTRDGFLGFDRVCEIVLGAGPGKSTFEACHRAFEWLPLAARVGGRVLVVHGGLGNGDWTLDQLRAVERPLESGRLEKALDGAVYNILWSDPLQMDRAKPTETFGAHQSPRSKEKPMQNFGRDVTEKFCKREHLGMVVRSHQFKKTGRCFELMHDGWLMRVFSARNYCGRHLNDGGFLLVGWEEAAPGGTLLVKPQAVERFSKFELMRGETVLEPYCPHSHLMQLVRSEPSARCLPFLGAPAREQSRECRECLQSTREEAVYFVCQGCGDYCLCLKCATASSHNAALPGDDSDSDAESGASPPAKLKLCGASSPTSPKKVEAAARSPARAAGRAASPPAGEAQHAAEVPVRLPTLLESRSCASPPARAGASGVPVIKDL